MLSLSRWFKFSLPVATATTASVATVLLITLSQVDPLKLFDIQDKELNDFELQSKTFEDEIIKEKGPDLEIQELSSDASDPKELEEEKSPVNIDSEEKNLEEELPKGEEPEAKELLSQQHQPNDNEDLSKHELSTKDQKEIPGPETGGPSTNIQQNDAESETLNDGSVDGHAENKDSDASDLPESAEDSGQSVIQGEDEGQGEKVNPPEANGQTPNKVFNSDEIGDSNVTDGGQGALTESDLVGWKEELENSVNVLFQLRAVTEKDLF